jgi:uroporphyrinogen III methyltransferase/synthase
VSGKVWLVGAGPGDPRLITVAAIDAVARAEVLVHDRLVHHSLIDLAPSKAERIFVGKDPAKKDGSGFSQQQINGLLVARAREGKRVVRLKGGDPFVFGRGGEEAEALAAAGVPFEVVPGVSSAIAVPAYAGISLTHRRLSSSFTVVTGHEDPDKPESAVDWGRVAKSADTLVILMGGANLDEIMKRLADSGRAPDEPVCVVRWGTTPDQRVLPGTIADVAIRVAEAGLTPPLIVVVGQVVRLREKLQWFEKLPLFGKRVLVTRGKQARSRTPWPGQARAIGCPLLRSSPVDRKALNGPAAASRRIRLAHLQQRQRVDIFFAVDGPQDERHRRAASAPSGRRRWPRTHPRATRAERTLQRASSRRGGAGIMGQRCSGRARGARRALIAGLERLGTKVDEVPLYSAAVPKEVDSVAMSRLRAGEVHAVTFASASAVRNLLKMLGDDRTALEKPLIACIGPVTATAARRAGLRVDVEAPEYTIEGLLETLRTHFETP